MTKFKRKWYDRLVIRQSKEIENLKEKKQLLQRQVTACMREMLQGSLITLTARCQRKGCECQKGVRVHGVKKYISVYNKKGTQMNYVPKELADEKDITPRLEAFEHYWELGKEISKINFALYKTKAKKGR